MSHASLMGRHIKIARPGPALIGSHNRHMETLIFDLRKQQLGLVDPTEARSVREPQTRFSAQNRHGPNVPNSPWNRVRDPRPVWGKNRAHLREIIVSELDRLAARQHLHVDLPGGNEARRPANEAE